ncbi:kinase-like domain-containing protein [Astrocystis sublimbata]|nr:kinase-like domain-containing protein [Astrocystis sublimbata]
MADEARQSPGHVAVNVAIDELLAAQQENLVTSNPLDGLSPIVEFSEEGHGVRAHFNNLPFIEFEAQIGHGVFGVTYRVIQKRFRQSPRRLIVKRARLMRYEDELITEIEMMTRLNGSAHIASVIDAREDGEGQMGFIMRLVAILLGRPHMLIGLPGPTLVLEYLEHGTLDRLLRVVRSKNIVLPNRLLWSIYLCLVRACIAMEFPPDKPFGSELELEEIPADGQAAAESIVHHDLHPGNVMIGTAGGDFAEHSIVPPVKLIDFGMADWGDDTTKGKNLQDVSALIYWLILREYPKFERHRWYRGIKTHAGRLLPPPAHRQWPFPLLDEDLRDLVMLGMAADPSECPSLAHALENCQHALRFKPPRFYGVNAARETDESIGQLLQEVLYDASTAP